MLGKSLVKLKPNPVHLYILHYRAPPFSKHMYPPLERIIGYVLSGHVDTFYLKSLWDMVTNLTKGHSLYA